MKFFRYLIIIVIIFPLSSFAVADSDSCSADGYSIATINGVSSDKESAIGNMDALSKKVGFYWRGQKIEYQYLLNDNHLGGVKDLVDVYEQKKNEDKIIFDYDFLEILRDASMKVKTQKLLLVAHSQGNFYANNFYDYLAGQPGGVPRDSIGVYGVATPARLVAGNGRYRISDTDAVITEIAAKFLPGSTQIPNIHFDLRPGDDETGHSFSDVYIKYGSKKIVEDIQYSLDKLSSDVNRLNDFPCINSPKLTVWHTIEGAALAAADPLATPIVGSILNSFRSLYVTAQFALNAGAAIGNSAALAFSSLFNNSNNTSSNAASVIYALQHRYDAPAEEVPPDEPVVDEGELTVEPQQGDLLADSTENPVTPVDTKISAPDAAIASGDTATTTVETLESSETVLSTSTPLLAVAPSADFGGAPAPAPAAAASENQNSDTGGGGSSADNNGSAGNDPGSPAATSTPDVQAKIKTIYSNLYIGTPIDVGATMQASAAHSIATIQLQNDVYSIRFKKASDFDCKTDFMIGHIDYGDNPMQRRIAQFDISSAVTDGQYCEYHFTDEYYGPVIKAGTLISRIYFGTNRHRDFLDGSVFNEVASENYAGIGTMMGGYAFQLCGIDGCDGTFIFPPDGVTLSTPTNQTYLYSPTFSGTYNNNAILNSQAAYSNNATFDKIVFEFTNNSLGAAPFTVERQLATNGSVVPYTEQIDIPTAGDWQYRARLLDTVNASSTPWSSLAYFTFAPRTAENHINARTVYTNSYIGTPIDVSGGYNTGSNVIFRGAPRTEDAYSVRIKKSSDFDCRSDVTSGRIFIASYPNLTKLVDFDIARATTDGSFCEYTFTENKTAIQAAFDLTQIDFVAVHSTTTIFLDGSIANGGYTMNGSGIWNLAPTYAFQLCNLAGCDGTFTVPSEGSGGSDGSDGSGSGSPVLSSARSITAFDSKIGTSTIVGNIDEAAQTIGLIVPFGTDVHTLAPSVAVSALATSSPASLATQDFTSPVLYTVTAEDGSTAQYTVTVTVSPDTTPPPSDIPDTTAPSITSYTFNGVAGDITADFATTTPTVTIVLNASENVDWKSIKIEDENNSERSKIFFNGAGCVDGTITCTKTWEGDLSHGSIGPDSSFKIKVHMVDTAGNEFDSYLTPYRIFVQ